MPTGWVGALLSAEKGEGGDQAGAGIARADHIVHVATGGDGERVGEAFFVVRDEFGAFGAGSGAAAISRREITATAASGPITATSAVGPGEVEVCAYRFGTHHHVCTAVRLARDHRELRHRRFTVGIQELRAMPDDAAVLLRRAGKKARHVFKGDERHIKGIAQPHKARRFLRGVNIERAREVQRLVRHDAHRVAIQPREAGEDVGCEFRLQLEPAIRDPPHA